MLAAQWMGGEQVAVRLRDYQEEALAAVREGVARGSWSQLLVLPTGSGKTVIFGALASERVQVGQRVLVLVHRDELLGQTVDKLLLVDPSLEGRIGVAGAGAVQNPYAPVLVGMVQTLARRLELVADGGFGLVVVDEAHHAVARQWRQVLAVARAGRPGCLLVGVTATPNRLDGVGLGALFQEVVYSRSIQEMVARGVLVPPRGLRLQTDVDLDQVRERHGDLDERELAQAVNTESRNQAVVRAAVQYCAGRKLVVFAAGVDHSVELARRLQAAGVPAAHVDGNMAVEQRRRVLADFREGRLQAVANCNVLTEGFDEPAIGAVMMARPTASEALYIQQVGRGLRRYPGKTDCLVVDVVDASHQHRLVQLADLFGQKVVAAAVAAAPAAAPAARGEAQVPAGAAAPLDGLELRIQAEGTELLSPYEWVPVGDGWVLVLPEVADAGRVGYVLVPDVRERKGWVAAEFRPGQEARLLHHKPTPIEWCQGLAESAADQLLSRAESSNARRLVEREAAWRQRVASAAQVAALQRLGVVVEEGITAGEASRRLTAHLWRRRVEWVLRQWPRLRATAAQEVGG